MAAGNHQSDARIDLSIGIGELTGVEVPFQVIDGDQWDLQSKGQRLGGRQADDQGPHQTGSRGDRNGTQVAERDARSTQGFVDHGQDLADLGPGCDLGHDSAVALMKATCEATTLDR